MSPEGTRQALRASPIVNFECTHLIHFDGGVLTLDVIEVMFRVGPIGFSRLHLLAQLGICCDDIQTRKNGYDCC